MSCCEEEKKVEGRNEKIKDSILVRNSAELFHVLLRSWRLERTQILDNAFNRRFFEAFILVGEKEFRPKCEKGCGIFFRFFFC